MDPIASAYNAHQQVINGPAATQMLRNSRNTLEWSRRFTPFLVGGVAVVAIFLFYILPAITGPSSFRVSSILYAAIVLVPFGVAVFFVLRRQRRQQAAQTAYLDAMIAQQEASQRGDGPRAE